jgi:4-diphosphocytidyl-2C-methyl-D-erythritol kinase
VINDLESVVSSRWPAVGEALTALKFNGEEIVAGMTGSGSALFCIAPEWTTDSLAAQKLKLLVKKIAPHDATIISCHIR